MLLVDAHVHIYDCFNLQTFLEAAYLNFKTHADRLNCRKHFSGILFLAETSKDNRFHHLSRYLEANDMLGDWPTNTWKLYRTSEDESLITRSDDNRELFLIAGRQIVTEEGLEVLALATTAAYRDGIPIKELLASVQEREDIPVIPWGVGKWIGRRGKIVTALVHAEAGKFFCLGDNSGRPFFWKRPFLFKIAESLNVPILPGSDPLPFRSEQKRGGSFGFSIDAIIDPMKPAESLRVLLSNGKFEIRSFGRLEMPHRFCFNQVRMQLRKRLAPSTC
jgi:hypothetical protein